MITYLAPVVMLTAQRGLSGTITLSNGKPAAAAVICLEGAAKAKPLEHVVVDQRDRRFLPHVTVVTVGTKVDFPNHDSVFHNVFTEYHSQKFDFGMYARGKTKSQVFDRPGLAVLLCSIHSEMSAYVMCVDTPYYAVCDGRGHFHIPVLPGGTYGVRIWHESGETFRQSRTLAPGENVDFQVRR